MKIYRIIEDGEGFCVKAKTMIDAIIICQNDFVSKNKDMLTDTAIKYYYDEVIESCTLI